MWSTWAEVSDFDVSYWRTRWSFLDGRLVQYDAFKGTVLPKSEHLVRYILKNIIKSLETMKISIYQQIYWAQDLKWTDNEWWTFYVKDGRSISAGRVAQRTATPDDIVLPAIIVSQVRNAFHQTLRGHLGTLWLSIYEEILLLFWICFHMVRQSFK